MDISGIIYLSFVRSNDADVSRPYVVGFDKLVDETHNK